MVRPGKHRGDDDLGPLTDRTDRVHGRSVTTSSREADEGGNNGDDDGGDDDQDEGVDVGDEEQPVPVAPANGSDERPRHGKGKGLTGSFMSMMSKIQGSRNKRPDVAREVLALTQKRKKVKASDWEQTGPADGGPIDPKLIPSYGGHVAGLWFIEVSIALHGTHRAWIYLYFPLFATAVRPGTEACKPYILQYPIRGLVFWLFHRVPVRMITWTGSSPAVTRRYRNP
ncbi:hypothetical protein M9H77_31624 [Catharanthus roseus]|uniref:Uncharacterized protein n=1 Tax=Catharanthus roseus TaxID=4058 RepID=A0ACC0A3B1_CATRO|nr:hypothetical protein M9H77_31624 [Catharanthus roseus]